MTFDRASTYLGGKADRPYGTGRATRLHRRPDGGIGLKYQATDVLVFYPDGRVVYDSGGYQTVTTKARMNDYGPLRIHQIKGLWYAADGLYQDGMTYHADGTITGLGDPDKSETAKRTIDRQVSRYIKAFCESVAAAREIKQPSAGDCLYCQMQIRDPIGPASFGGVDHVMSHFGGTDEEPDPYFVPSLVARAIVVRGYRVPAVIWHVIESEATRGETRMLGDVLRAFFRKLKPALLPAAPEATAAAAVSA